MRELDLTLSSLEVADVLCLLSQLRPEWNTDQIKFKIFTEGISNATRAFYIEELESDETLVVRLNGNGTEEFLDREKEIEAYRRLSDGGICPPLIATFNNGLVMSMLRGKVFTGESVKNEVNATLTAKAIARMHKNVSLKDDERAPSLLDTVKHFLSLVKEHTLDYKEGELVLSKGTSIVSFFEAEFAYVEEALRRQSSPLVVCHNDLLLANFLHEGDTVSIIDYEYLAPNPAAFDISNHFNEYAGTEVFDFDNCPDEKYRRWWLVQYLSEFLETNNPDTTTIDKWMADVDAMAPLSHLLWGTWALVQLEKSEIDFDYGAYAVDRLRCYYQLKREAGTQPHLAR